MSTIKKTFLASMAAHMVLAAFLFLTPEPEPKKECVIRLSSCVYLPPKQPVAQSMPKEEPKTEKVPKKQEPPKKTVKKEPKKIVPVQEPKAPAKPAPVLEEQAKTDLKMQEQNEKIAEAKPVLPEPKQTVPEAEIEAIKSAYIQELRAAIEANKAYPTAAKRLRQEGIVEVVFVIAKDGAITAVRVQNPSRFGKLNEGAIKTVQNVGKFKPIPRELGMNAWELVVPIKFELM